MTPTEARAQDAHNARVAAARRAILFSDEQLAEIVRALRDLPAPETEDEAELRTETLNRVEEEAEARGLDL